MAGTDETNPQQTKSEHASAGEGEAPFVSAAEDNQVTTESNEVNGHPFGQRGLIAVLLIVVLSDLVIYRGEGFAGVAVLLAVAPLLICLGAAERHTRNGLWIIAAMLILTAAKLIWCGSALLVVCGFVLLCAFAASLSGRLPYVSTIFFFALELVPAGFVALGRSGHAVKESGTERLYRSERHWLNVVLPVVTCAVFAFIFVLANPDLFDSFSQRLTIFFENIRQMLVDFSPFEVLFWCAVAVVAAGLIRPRAASESPDEPVPTDEQPPREVLLYLAFRNTLLTVVVLFAAYLIFEFKTLWFRVFPVGFYYAGYAHEGAAWLTIALALATLILSLFFRGPILSDPRLPRLRTLAWIWSAQNFLLAIAVYNRLLIYINFNGMTRMRTIGLFGITCVVVGFILVLYRISRHRRFRWLVRRQLWTLAIAIFAYAITPVDTLVHSYNVRQVMNGDLAPSVQISVHPIDAQGLLVLSPLLECEDANIRDGIRAMLAEQHFRFESDRDDPNRPGWTAWQLSEQMLRDQLRSSATEWTEFRDSGLRSAARQRFDDYVYQWY